MKKTTRNDISVEKLSVGMEKIAKGEFLHRIEIDSDSELSSLEKDFNRMALLLERTREFKRNFLLDATHQLKNPLTSIKNLAEALILTDSQDINLYKEYLQDINRETDRLTIIVQKLLRVYEADFDYKVEKEATNINDFIKGATKNMLLVAKAKDIEILYKIAPDLTWPLRKRSFYHMIINLIDNSIKYSDPGTEIWIRGFVKDDNLIIEVEDQGIGIHEKHIPHVMENFYKVHPEGYMDTASVGLGLPLVKRLTEYHDGTLDIESKEGEGTKITISIPISNNETNIYFRDIEMKT